LTGIFTAAQAERGKTAYGQNCATCHGANLVSVVEEAPSLTGFTFGTKFVGKTVGERYEKIRTTMPVGGEGSLPDQTYLDIIAFILSFNGYPAGSTELTPAINLKAITIPKAQ
jgi:mono/diheme cytochrome c family protein